MGDALLGFLAPILAAVAAMVAAASVLRRL